MKLPRFFEFITEKIVSTETEYGNKKPFNNKQFSQQDDEIFTFFQHENVVIVVSYERGGSISFGILQNNESNKLHSETSVSFSRIQEFYGKLIYTIIQMINNFNITKFYFYSSPFEPKVEKLYKTFVKNPNIQSIFKTMGFEYTENKITQNGNTFIVHNFNNSKISIKFKK